MKVGDLVRNIHTDVVFVVTETADNDYVIVSSKYLMPEEHLEVLSESLNKSQTINV